MLVLTCLSSYVYKGIQGEPTFIKHKIKKVVPENKKMRLVYTEAKLGTKFNVKDKTKIMPHPDVFWYCLISMGAQKSSCNTFSI